LEKAVQERQALVGLGPKSVKIQLAGRLSTASL
jgi:hypothetical protein